MSISPINAVPSQGMCYPDAVSQGTQGGAVSLVAPGSPGPGLRATPDAAFRVLYFSGSDGKLRESFVSRESIASVLSTVLAFGGLVVGVYLCD